MILADRELRKWAEGGGIQPYCSECVNPASVDLRLAGEFVDLLEDDLCFETAVVQIYPGDAILASTMEFIQMPVNCAGTVYLKSSKARQGLDHSLAGFVDPGFCGTLTLELHAHRHIVLMAGERVIQLVLHRLTSEPERPYDGRYQGQVGPTPARPAHG